MAHQPVAAALDEDAVATQHTPNASDREQDPGKHGRSLRERLDPEGRRSSQEMTAAMKAGDKLRLGALRMLAAAIKNREKEVVHELSDDEVREVAGKEVKRRTESIEAFDAAGRTELADKERAEREVVSRLRARAAVRRQVDALDRRGDRPPTGATSPQEMGKVMGVVMGKAKGQVDGSVVQPKVRERLNES